MMLRPSAIELNPKQAQAWQVILSQPQIEIKGWTILEQLHFVEQLALNALVYGEKCLILNIDTEHVKLIKTKLEKDQLADYCIWNVASAALNKHLLRDIHAQMGPKRKISSPNKTIGFDLALDKLERLQLRLNKTYQAVRKPVFGNLNWPALLGLYWSNQTQMNSGALNISLLQDTYDFNFEEYQKLLSMIQEAQSLYHLVQRLDHPLQQLNAQIFLKKDEKTAERFSQEKLGAYQARFGTLAQKYNQHIDDYGRLLRQYFEQYTQEFLHETDQLLDQIKDNTSKYGEPFLNAKLGKIKWYRPLSAQGKSAIGAYKKLIQAYEALKQKFERLAWFTFAWPTPNETRSIAPLKQALESFGNTLKSGHHGLGQFIQEEQLRLNAKSVLPGLVSKVQIAELEEEMDELLAEFNTTEVLDHRLDNKMLTLHKRKQYLGQVQQQLANLQQNMSDFVAFYNWQRFWLQRTALEQNLLKALAENSLDTWLGAFQNWYIYQVLLRTKSIDVPLGAPPLKEYYQSWLECKASMPEQINRVWQQKKTILQKNSRGIKISSKNETELLTQAELETYTDLFPILCFGAEFDTEIMPQLSSTIFDWVVVWTTTSHTSNQLSSYSNLGKKLIVFSSDQEIGARKTEEDPNIELENGINFFWSNFRAGIHPYFGTDRLKQTLRLDNGLILPLAFEKDQQEEREIAFLGDGFLSQMEATDYAWEWQQQEQLKQEAWELIPVWSAACWQNLPAECRKIAAQIISLEKQKSK
ncbi:MAG: hypothetical protein SFV55_28150 [Haliscomenobacter sp.]|uniref:hypothetical protein n=1 Tax=Haliscomenobacter sp. TaxID=2717303 RepID=UPI0029A87EED|nr:hypothetical protein [Haliscomenobacter sp.]MDX2072339.1 hypothetical protein [Haliscomenobacter sp.]